MAIANQPQVVVDGAGTAHAVWYRSNGTHNIVQAAVRPAGGAWSAAVDLSAAGQNANQPQVAVDSAGTAHAVWFWYNGANQIVQAAVRPVGGVRQQLRQLQSGSVATRQQIRRRNGQRQINRFPIGHGS